MSGSTPVRDLSNRPSVKHMGLRLCVVTTVLMLFGQAFAKTAPQHWHDKRYIEHSFYDIVLQGEHEKVRPVVRKWNRPLHVWVSSSAGDAEQQQWLIATHIAQIGEITGLPIRFVNRREQANVRVFFTSEREAPRVVEREMSRAAARQLSHAVCLGQIRYNRSGEILRGSVVIPVERAQVWGKLLPCVVEEMTQMLGLINDSKFFYPTVFSDITRDELLTGLDYLLLKLLYSPQIRSGMTVSEVAPLIRQQLAQWERDGLIRHSSLAVTESPLYALPRRR